MLEEKIKNDLVLAMKAKDKKRLDVIRMVKAAVDLEHINTKKDITDDLIIDVLNKQLKMRKDSIIEFEKAGRDDLKQQTLEEIDILMEYMPKQLEFSEVEKIVDDAINAISNATIKDMGRIMKEITPLLKGKTDMKLVSDMIRERLS